MNETIKKTLKVIKCSKTKRNWRQSSVLLFFVVFWPLKYFKKIQNKLKYFILTSLLTAGRLPVVKIDLSKWLAFLLWYFKLISNQQKLIRKTDTCRIIGTVTFQCCSGDSIDECSTEVSHVLQSCAEFTTVASIQIYFEGANFFPSRGTKLWQQAPSPPTRGSGERCWNLVQL